MAIRYLGSKSRLSHEILEIVGQPSARGRFVDPFSGTGSVSREAAERGWSVRANDLLPSAAALTRAQLTTSQEVPFRLLGGYHTVIEALNHVRPQNGYFYKEYSPSSQSRLYFTVENARRIDAMRALVAQWTAARLLKPLEHQLILADIIEAVNAVANTAGTYGCFLRTYDPRALKPIEVRARTFLVRSRVASVTIGDAADVETSVRDVLYLDPPYTKRQYAAYYHILETLAAGDTPAVHGVTGLRPWKDRSSAYCYKTRALDSMCTLLASSKASRILVSYSVEGHVHIDDMRRRFAQFGKVIAHEIGAVQRYAPNAASAERDGTVREILIEIRRSGPRKSVPTQLQLGH